MKDRRVGWSLLVSVLIKATVLFALLNLAFALTYPRRLIGSLSGYNWIYPGRERFPHGDVPEKSFNITTSNLEAMFRSHVFSIPAQDEFRVAIIGDSSVWGFLLRPDQTFTAQLNRFDLESADGRQARFYNLGYPTLSATKDLLILERVMDYDPDMVVWFTTLESLPLETQLESPLLQHNPIETRMLTESQQLDLPGMDAALVPPNIWQKTIVGSRVELSELIRLQLYGFAWAATGVDHYIPESYNERAVDLSAARDYKDYAPGEMKDADLNFKAFETAIRIAGEIPVLLVNEPIFISSGENSEIRYNFFYPRWAYDQFRSDLHQQADDKGWRLLDLWDAIPPEEFTDSAIHYSESGANITARLLVDFLIEESNLIYSGR